MQFLKLFQSISFVSRSPTKAKKTKPGFKFAVKKDIFPRMKEKVRTLDADQYQYGIY